MTVSLCQCYKFASYCSKKGRESQERESSKKDCSFEYRRKHYRKTRVRSLCVFSVFKRLRRPGSRHNLSLLQHNWQRRAGLATLFTRDVSTSTNKEQNISHKRQSEGAWRWRCPPGGRTLPIATLQLSLSHAVPPCFLAPADAVCRSSDLSTSSRHHHHPMMVVTSVTATGQRLSAPVGPNSRLPTTKPSATEDTHRGHSQLINFHTKTTQPTELSSLPYQITTVTIIHSYVLSPLYLITSPQSQLHTAMC
jgi:hypothetical protein